MEDTAFARDTRDLADIEAAAAVVDNNCSEVELQECRWGFDIRRRRIAQIQSRGEREGPAASCLRYGLRLFAPSRPSHSQAAKRWFEFFLTEAFERQRSWSTLR